MKQTIYQQQKKTHIQHCKKSNSSGMEISGIIIIIEAKVQSNHKISINIDGVVCVKFQEIFMVHHDSY